MLGPPNNISQEKLFVVTQNEYKFDEVPETQSILSDFDNLHFSNGPFNYNLYDMNYNEGKEANPFDKIAKYYGRKQNVFLFISMLRDEEQLKKVNDIVSKKCDLPAQEKFMKRINIYLDRISKGEADAKEFLSNNESLDVFFNGPHTGENCNIHANLNINISKPGQILETSNFFGKTKTSEEKEKEIKRVKIYSNGKRMLTIKKIDKQQRNYCFTPTATCEIEISWNAKDESGKETSCVILLSINSGQIGIKKSSIDGKNVEPKEILELALQNKAVLIQDKALHVALQTCEEMKGFEDFVIIG